MNSPRIEDLLPDELRQFMARTGEKDYVLIDVRQPQEYAIAHIPGATLLPLMDLESRLFDLPTDRRLVFYCSHGARSEIAAALAAEAELSDLPVYTLVGGMLGWDGHKLSDFPRIQIFDRAHDLPALLMTAMDLEKGAFRYYRLLLDLFGHLSFRQTLAQLSRDEETHARMIYALWQPAQSAERPFMALFDGLPGEILEGGASLADMRQHLATARPDTVLQALELSLRLEYEAYDLYRSMAARPLEKRVQEALLDIAQAEKSHMRRLTRAIADLY
jgi:rhodanese-related sulfurtransferase/rubrerythrin